ncbi:MAG: glycosyltransferase 87 family protein [Nocardioides sp.]
MRTAGVSVTWVASRALLVWLLLGPQEWVRGDVTYFDRSLSDLGQVGVRATLVEYPVPALAVLGLPWLLARAASSVLGIADAYNVLLMLAAAVTDLAFTVLLARRQGSRLGLLAWLLAVPLLGVTAYARFDLLPGVLCGAAVLALPGRPRVAAAAVAVATGIKLWPALVIPPLLAVVRPRGPATSVLAGTGLALALVSVVVGGWERLFSPLTYQADRGLQIESVLATPAMLGWLSDHGRWQVAYATSKAYEVTGPGVGTLLALSSALTVVYVVGLAAAWWRLWVLRDRVRGTTVLWVALAAVTGFVVVGKVLSPQYLLWLAPLAAAGLTVEDHRRLRWWTAGLLLAMGLTQVVFPANYGQITLLGDRAWLPVAALALRNVVVVALLATAVAAVVSGLRRDAQRWGQDRRPATAPAALPE